MNARFMEQKILLVEDCDELRRGVAGELRYHFQGLITICQANSSESGIDMMDQESPDLVVTDLCMPGEGDGEKVIVAAHEKGVPVIVFSGSVEGLAQDLRDLCLGIVDKLEGDSVERLVEVVREWLLHRV